MKNKCALCNGNLRKEIVDYKIYGESLGKFPAMVCQSCGEQWFDEETSIKIEKAEKKANLFGLSRESKISYSGNSLIIRIPKDIAKFMDLKKESIVTIYPHNKNKISIDINK
ncbi:MAG: YgiT-type zinc finger protein [Nanoarchaeota archaeon]